MILWTTNVKRVCIGLASLTVGVLIYWIDRPGSILGANGLGMAYMEGDGRFFGAAGYSLPAFLHAFAFSLLTASLLPERRAIHAATCAGWLAVDSTFELLQHPELVPSDGQLLTTLGEYGPLGRVVSEHFRNGVFDTIDVACIILGALFAYATLSITREHEEARR